MTAWLNDLVTTATADLRRTQCAEAATARIQNPQVNLIGLGDSGEATRRAKCLEAAMMRFVLGNAVVDDPLDADRWDYVYSISIRGGEPIRKVLSVYFIEDRLSYFVGDFVPTESMETAGAD